MCVFFCFFVFLCLNVLGVSYYRWLDVTGSPAGADQAGHQSVYDGGHMQDSPRMRPRHCTLSP